MRASKGRDRSCEQATTLHRASRTFMGPLRMPNHEEEEEEECKKQGKDALGIRGYLSRAALLRVLRWFLRRRNSCVKERKNLDGEPGNPRTDWAKGGGAFRAV